MKSVALVATLALTSAGCAGHPAATIGVATGVIGFGGCEIDEVRFGDCAAIGAITGVFFAGLGWLLYHYTDSNAHELRMDEAIGSGGALELHTFTPPPPVPIDAGIAIPDVMPTIVDAGVAPTIVDAAFDQPAP